MCLKDSEQKFSRDLAEIWQDFRDKYDQISSDYSLSNDQNFQFMHSLLRKDAHRFFLESVKPNVETYHKVANLL